MKIKFSNTNFLIAGVHLTSRLKQTLVAILGVTFGISMYIAMNSFMEGVNQTLNELVFSTMAHIRIYNKNLTPGRNLLVSQYGDDKVIHLRNKKNLKYEEGIRFGTPIIETIAKHPEVNHIAPQVNMNVFYRSGAARANGIISGVIPENEDEMFEMEDKIRDGAWYNIQTNKRGIILGKILADDLGLSVRDHVNVVTPDGISKNLEIVGIFEATIQELEMGKGYVHISTARELLGENRDYVTDIQVNLEDFNRADAVANELQPAIPYTLESWQAANEQLKASNILRDAIALAASLTILIVAGFGIYNIMNMTITEKIKEIAILKAMGFNGRDIRQIFLSQALIIGFIGGCTGLILGFLFSVGINQIPFGVAGMETLPVVFTTWDFILAFLFGMLTTLFAGYAPARMAAKVDPVSIIRG